MWYGPSSIVTIGRRIVEWSILLCGMILPHVIQSDVRFSKSTTKNKVEIIGLYVIQHLRLVDGLNSYVVKAGSDYMACQCGGAIHKFSQVYDIA